MATTAAPPPAPQISQSERWKIADQLGLILTSPWFRTSSRSSLLLRHVVEGTIHGQADRLKERQIAIDAFHRKPTYDNNTDPVVRIVAGEVRKRLAQYYSDPDSDRQIRIELPIGSYVPVFHFPEEPDPVAESPAPALQIETTFDNEDRTLAPQPNAREAAPDIRHPRQIWLPVLAVVLLVTAAGVTKLIWPQLGATGFDKFWAPVLSPNQAALISVGELRAQELTFVPNVQRNQRSDAFRLDLKEAPGGVAVERLDYSKAVARVASVFGAKKKAFDVRDQSETSFADISGKPIILIGSYDNDWSMGISEGVGARFQIKADPQQQIAWIADRNQPGKRIGSLSISSQEPATYDVFSIVIRHTGVVSRQCRVILAGVGDKGTSAAAEFVSTPRYLDEFAQHAPKGWEHKNIEFLIQTRVIENVVGTPQIVDFSIW